MKSKYSRPYVIALWNYNDPLISVYVLPYLKIIYELTGSPITLFCFAPSNDNLNKNKIPFYLNIELVPFKKNKIIRSFYSILSIFKIIKSPEFKSSDIIHAWCTPAAIFGYYLSIFSGKKLIIDSFEPHADSMVENGAWSKNSFAFHFLAWHENKSTRHANILIACAAKMADYVNERYRYDCTLKLLHKPACVDIDKFSKIPSQPSNKIRGIYVGKFGGIYLEDEIFEYVKFLFLEFNNHVEFTFLSPHDKSFFEKKFKQYGLDDFTINVFNVDHEQVPTYLNNADFALSPIKPVPSKKYCSPIKNGEYWAAGLPIIISKNISDDSAIVSAYDIGFVMEDWSKKSMLSSFSYIRDVIQKADRVQFRLKIISIAEKFRSYEIAKKTYSKIYTNE